MVEYIACRRCNSTYCNGCNIYTLATMLDGGKFDCLMNEHRSVKRFADVAPVVHGRWETHTFKKEGMTVLLCICSNCDCRNGAETNFCPNCGADMREREGDE